MKHQLKYWLHAPFVLPVFPILYAQAMRVKKTMLDLPDAQGDNFGELAGEGLPYHIVGLGESTISGVGCRHHGEAVTGQLARHLGQKTGRAVRYEAIGKTGIKVQHAIHELVPILPEKPIDMVLVALGGNDTFHLNQPRHLLRSFADLLTAIRDRQPDCAIVIANLPTVWQFTVFTPLMHFVMGRLVRLHAGAIKELPLRFPRVWYMNYPIDLHKWEQHLPPGQSFSDLFADGVHPAPLTCQLWGNEIADFVLDNGVLEGGKS